MNLTALQTAIQDKGYATDTATQQINAINAAYRDVIGKHRWSFLERQTTLLTAIGVSLVDLSGIADLRDDAVNAVRLSYSSTDRFEIDYVDPQDLRTAQHRYPDTGEPEVWTIINGDIQLWPTPDRVYTVTVDYIGTVNALSAGSDTPVFDPTYHDVLVWGAIADMTFRERDYSGAAWANQMFQVKLGEMERAYGVRQKQSVRHVQRSKFWGSIGKTSGWDGLG